MVNPNYLCNVDFGWLIDFGSGLCYCSFYIYDILDLNMFILGISAFYHDSAASLIKNGEIVAAAQEERFTRKKMTVVSQNAIEYCL